MKVLGIDVGGSGIKGAVVDTENGQLITDRYRITTPKPATPKAVSKAVQKIVNRFDWRGKVGCGFPAVIQHGIVRTASNIDKSWIGVNAVNLFQESIQCETTVINDADAAGMAEMRFGAGKDNNGMVIIITVGTGIGTSIFSNQTLLPNTELGHIIMDGKIAEDYVSDVIRKDADLSWKKWSNRFNKYLLELERLFWPDLIIIGGGASKKHEKFFDFLSIRTKILSARLQNEAGIVGAALAAISEIQ